MVENSVNKAVGMSRCGRTTKIHAVVDGLGKPVEFLPSRGNDHDSTHAIELLNRIDISKSNVLGDKAYGSKAIREYITEQKAAYTIPPGSRDCERWFRDWRVNKERRLVECFFQKLKRFRRIATRYDKLDSYFLGFIYLASISILLI